MTTPTRITKDNVLILLEEVVQDKGADYVYDRETCEYIANVDVLDEAWTKGEDVDYSKLVPACIVGHVLYRARLLDTGDPDVMNVVFQNEQADSLASTDAVTREAAIVLEAAQHIQDGTTFGMFASTDEAKNRRGTWGDALKAARRAYDELDQVTGEDEEE